MAPTACCSERVSSPARNHLCIPISNRRYWTAMATTRCCRRSPILPLARFGLARCRARCVTDSSSVGPDVNGHYASARPKRGGHTPSRRADFHQRPVDGHLRARIGRQNLCGINLLHRASSLLLDEVLKARCLSNRILVARVERLSDAKEPPVPKYDPCGQGE